MSAPVFTEETVFLPSLFTLKPRGGNLPRMTRPKKVTRRYAVMDTFRHLDSYNEPPFEWRHRLLFHSGCSLWMDIKFLDIQMAGHWSAQLTNHVKGHQTAAGYRIDATYKEVKLWIETDEDYYLWKLMGLTREPLTFKHPNVHDLENGILDTQVEPLSF